MAENESMFLFELFVDEFKSVDDEHDYEIVAQFADVLNITLRRPQNWKSKKKKRKTKKGKHKKDSGSRLQMSQAILLESSIKNLRQKMENNPLKITIQAKVSSGTVLGFTEIPWGPQFYEYLNSLPYRQDSTSIASTTKHKIYESITSEHLANINIKIRISFFRYSYTPPSIVNDDQKAIKKALKNLQIDKETFDDDIQFYEEPPVKALTIVSSGEELQTKVKLRDLISKKESNIPENVNEQQTLSKLDITVPLFDSRKIMLALPKSTSNINSGKPLSPEIVFRSFDSMWQKINDSNRPNIGNTSFYVGYAMQSKHSGSVDPPKSTNSSKGSQSSREDKNSSSKQSSGSKGRNENLYKFNLCESTCGRYKPTDEDACVVSLDLPDDAKALINVAKCKEVDCENREYRKIRKYDERILMKLRDPNEECCKNVDETEKKGEKKKDMPEKKKQVVLKKKKEEMSKKKKESGKKEEQLKKDDTSADPCYCTCDCRFEFSKKTTYCDICGGYEIPGEDLTSIRQPGQPLPYPCPIYNKLDKTKGISSSDHLSVDRYTKGSKGSQSSKVSKSSKGSTSRDLKEKIDKNRFKFRRGYEGIPVNIGKDDSPKEVIVPKNMGWKWNAKDIPGLKERKNYKPGGCFKKVVRMLKVAKNPELHKMKKTRGKMNVDLQKRPVKRPLLAVHKKDGDIIVTIETMKSYPNTRLLNQQPFVDKDPLYFTVGKTEEEKMARKKRKERRARLLEYDQREYIKNCFRNLCHRVCKKVYEQALGILPGMGDDPVYSSSSETLPSNLSTRPSCECKECELSSEDTDSDEWMIGFTPPIAYYNPKSKMKKATTVEKNTQHCYLDYRVKILDKKGNPIPRFFIGPDGKRECSDLGGFWGPNKQWLEINVDGFIAQDSRWAPYSFTGPGNEQIITEEAKFRTATGEWLVIGEDGYIENGKWNFYKTPKESVQKKISKVYISSTGIPGGGKESETPGKYSVSSHSFPQLGITGHGRNKKLVSEAVRRLIAKGEVIQKPKTRVPRVKTRSTKAKPVPSYNDRFKCKHALPSPKGILAVDDKGRKIYFSTVDHQNKQVEKERLVALKKHGIKLSSYHVPCLRSFVNNEELKQYQYRHILNHNSKLNRASQMMQT